MPKTMDRSDFYRQEMIDEFKTILDLIDHEENLERQIYFFSAAYGMTQKTLRNDFTREVLLMDLVLTNTYNLLIQRLNQIKNRDLVISPDILQNASKEVFKEFEILITKLERNEPYYENLMNILTAGFITTGSGNYLHEKGMIY